jgi:hypothetical protein
MISTNYGAPHYAFSRPFCHLLAYLLVYLINHASSYERNNGMMITSKKRGNTLKRL